MEYAFKTVRELAKLIKSKKVSSTELTHYFLERLEKYGEKFGAVVTVTKELALKQAKRADEEIRAGKYRGILHGIPFGVKDLLAAKGYPTTWGAAPYKDQVFDFDATVVQKLYGAGAVLVAKLAMVELAGGMGYDDADASFTGPGRTPWNTNYWSGGSSSGPGAAVSAGLVSFAIGSETSGSIINPSSFCGITGLRPSYGLVSRHGAMALAWTLDKLGPMCLSADDCGIVLNAVAGKDPNDETSVENNFTYKSFSRLRKRPVVGVVKGSYEKVQPAVKENFLKSIKVLSQFAEVKHDVEVPDLSYGQIVDTIVDAEGASAFSDLIFDGKLSQLQNKEDKVGGYSMALVPAIDYLGAMRERKKVRIAFDKFISQFDAIVAPGQPTVSYPIGVDFDKVYTEVEEGPSLVPAGNLAGLPAIALPNGFGDNNLPTSIQFMSKAFTEKTLLELGNEMQNRTDWHKKHPKVD